MQAPDLSLRVRLKVTLPDGAQLATRDDVLDIVDQVVTERINRAAHRIIDTIRGMIMNTERDLMAALGTLQTGQTETLTDLQTLLSETDGIPQETMDAVGALVEQNTQMDDLIKARLAELAGTSATVGDTGTGATGADAAAGDTSGDTAVADETAADAGGAGATGAGSADTGTDPSDVSFA